MNRREGSPVSRARFGYRTTSRARGAAVARAVPPTRRALLRTAFGIGVVAATAGVLAPILTRATARAVRAPAPPAERFTEMYRGRHIEGVVPSGPTTQMRADGGPGNVATAAPCGPEVFIDGRPLHVMRCADGGYLSVVNHYESFPTLLAAARAAVDGLGPAQLSQTLAHT